MQSPKPDSETAFQAPFFMTDAVTCLLQDFQDVVLREQLSTTVESVDSRSRIPYCVQLHSEEKHFIAMENLVLVLHKSCQVS